ncbi:uncharacterized protein LACBIDRAFT_327964 [Laccaria bicolor S238N-H82]|uniref:Predicted protein n=1 Tax=Laccaria bicolor (strain S238N-H82 / ATCC MYA-4686) TaxID=486041 RepID=B0DDD7_LACBS|nr:uncharacterized protein LACBIDRAFT_327964 [Laccaria bicolor S238N-H82]EDR07592.1 predicted protein [Laccaria bicolor S238N-H82]|eukprot:XP_001881984.1 predicted protein [Laccaria bicolor S238N-H82]
MVVTTYDVVIVYLGPLCQSRCHIVDTRRIMTSSIRLRSSYSSVLVGTGCGPFFGGRKTMLGLLPPMFPGFWFPSFQKPRNQGKPLKTRNLFFHLTDVAGTFLVNIWQWPSSGAPMDFYTGFELLLSGCCLFLLSSPTWVWTLALSMSVHILIIKSEKASMISAVDNQQQW